ncbi:MAG: hypothetical protein ACRDCT_24575 [Shewanella sp.]
MTRAARRLQWLLLLISFSAVFRPNWTGQLDRTDHEGMRTGFRQPDNASGASSVQKLHFPVWCLLVHFGNIEKRASRSAIRRMRLAGVHQPARHLLLSHGMSTTHTPLERLVAAFCDETKTWATLRVFVGVGLYFMILLLLCHDVERHPGPSITKLRFLSLKFRTERLLKTVQGEKCSAEDLLPLIDECIDRFERDAINIERLENRIANLEKEQRRKNIVVFGVPTENNLNNVVNDVVLSKLPLKRRLKKDEIIEKSYRFGKDSPQRPILIKFKTERDKKHVMKQAHTLRGTSVCISDDLTTEERQARRKIVNAHKAARAENIESKIMRKGLLVNDEIVLSAELSNSNWLRNCVLKTDNGVPLAIANECSPPATPTHEPRKFCPNTPLKNPNKLSCKTLGC